MFCPKCGCALPDVARFCVKCGSRTRLAEPSPSPTVSVDATMFCVNCGQPYEAVHRYCNFCGHALKSNREEPELFATVDSHFKPSGDAVPSVTGESQYESLPEAVETQEEVSGQPLTPPIMLPVAGLVGSALSSALMASVVAFVLADDLARGEWLSLAWVLLAAVFAVVLLKRSRAIYAILRKSEGGDANPPSKKLLVRLAVFATLFIIVASTVGALIGTSGSETNRFLADIDQLKTIGTQISQARDSAARTIPSQLAMYEAIEANVNKLIPIATRLQAEVEIYDRKYESQHKSTAALAQDIQVTTRRLQLLTKQIAVAKEIRPLDPDEEWAMWNSRMKPLLAEEDALDQSTK